MNIGCLARAIFLCALTPGVSFSLTINVTDRTIGTTPRYIGANEGGQFSAAYMADCGINAYRLYADMSRLEPADDDGAYGSPSIAAIRADPSIIDWTKWDAAFASAPWWGYSPGFGGCIEDLTAHGIEPVVCLRNRDPGGYPAWAPPQNDWNEADWNEWWEFCFSVAYWCNVRRGYGVARFEILNEPDLPAQGWSGTRPQYAELVANAADAIRFANGLAGVPAIIHAPAVADYTSPYLHDALGVLDAHVDAADYHTYADTVEPTVAHVRGDAEACDTDAVVEPVWVTEWGTYNGSYNTLARADLTCRQLYDFSAAGVEGLCIFLFFDWGGFSGLVTNAGAKTETYYAYRLMCKGLSGARDILAVSSSNPAKRVMATRGGGCVCVIAVDAGETVAVNLAGAGVEAGRYAVYEYSSARKDAIASSGSLSGGRSPLRPPRAARRAPSCIPIPRTAASRWRRGCRRRGISRMPGTPSPRTSMC